MQGRFISQKKITQYNIHLFKQQYSKSTTSTKGKTQRHLKLNIHTAHFTFFYIFHSSIYLHLHISHSYSGTIAGNRHTSPSLIHLLACDYWILWNCVLPSGCFSVQQFCQSKQPGQHTRLDCQHLLAEWVQPGQHTQLDCPHLLAEEFQPGQHTQLDWPHLLAEGVQPGKHTQVDCPHLLAEGVQPKSAHSVGLSTPSG